MKIDGNQKPQTPAPRRFQAAKSPPSESGRFFGDALRKVVAAGQGPKPQGTPGPQAAAGPASAPDTPAAPASPPEAPASVAPEETAGKPIAPGAEPAEGSAESGGESASFEDHMEQVRLRLKSGYYTSKNIDEALSDRLSGYFDDLA